MVLKEIKLQEIKLYHGIRLKDPEKLLEEGLPLWDEKKCKEEVEKAFNYFEKNFPDYLDKRRIKENREKAFEECEWRFGKRRGIWTTVYVEGTRDLPESPEILACRWADRNPEIISWWILLTVKESLLERDKEKVVRVVREYLEKNYGKPYVVEIDFDKIKEDIVEYYPFLEKRPKEGLYRYILLESKGGVNFFVPMKKLSKDVVVKIEECKDIGGFQSLVEEGQ